ncbi:MarR family winged helix-turn-helix transcriptional regulator [Actinotalea subterranea]|uniref:MarR family winged helix-turn-helix transcriptional regulator n=1 Tax=Actinotalea subterranea TaxID=2607497 RepID=UPI0011EE2183|nr:MarR family transcriptional regulator [Actinotalea subterranea]
MPSSKAAGPTTHADEDVRWLTESQQRSWRAYLNGSARLTEALTRQLDQEAQLSLSEYEILVRLSETPGRILRMSELASSLVHSRSRLTHTINRLQARGLVSRQANPEDGRGVDCVMTDEGFALLRDAAPGHVRAVRANLVDVLTDTELEVLGRAMDRIALPPSGSGSA